PQAGGDTYGTFHSLFPNFHLTLSSRIYLSIGIIANIFGSKLFISVPQIPSSILPNFFAAISTSYD
ncbi:MAG: hypothetical protein EZS28_037714, partial [Streblomastix strix]